MAALAVTAAQPSDDPEDRERQFSIPAELLEL